MILYKMTINISQGHYNFAMTFKMINQEISKHQPKYQKKHILKFRAIYKL